jgi:hypothetical protein
MATATVWSRSSPDFSSGLLQGGALALAGTPGFPRFPLGVFACHREDSISLNLFRFPLSDTIRPFSSAKIS